MKIYPDAFRKMHFLTYVLWNICSLLGIYLIPCICHFTLYGFMASQCICGEQHTKVPEDGTCKSRMLILLFTFVNHVLNVDYFEGLQKADLHVFQKIFQPDTNIFTDLLVSKK